jgi:hypothetical protein
MAAISLSCDNGANEGLMTLCSLVHSGYVQISERLLKY